MVYFIQAVDGGPIKIGTSVRLSERLKTLAKEAGKELRVLAVVQGSYAQERSLHQRFDHLHVVDELFEPGDDLLVFIVETGQEWDGSDEPSAKKPIASFRGTEEFAAWFEGLANHVHLPASVLIEHALRQYAERQGYKPPAPKR